MISSWLIVLLVFLATHRLTRLVIKDEVPIVKVPRDATIRFLDPTPEQIASRPGIHGHWGSTGKALAYLLECPWCMSVWVGGVVVWVTAFTAGLPVPWLVWAAASTVTGMIANFEHRQDQADALDEIAKRRALAEEQREMTRR